VALGNLTVQTLDLVEQPILVVEALMHLQEEMVVLDW
jgi:hypothetical protein